MKCFGRWTALIAGCALLAGCKLEVLFPSGDIAIRQRDVILISTGLMLLIIVPVMLLTVIFAWWYRESNIDAKHDPDWHHSTQLEVVIWAAPLLIIVALGALTWISTHTLDPFRPLGQIEPNRPVPAGTKPLTVEVVALDWKWLFIYPEQGIASLNEMAAPVNVPIQFKITSSTVMNTFYVPAMAGMIYAMPGMQSQLHAVINDTGEFTGISANYSGAGFSDMHFKFYAFNNEDFGKWIAQVKSSGTTLDRKEYMALEQPSEREPVRHYRTVDAGLFDAVLNFCVDPARPCQAAHTESRRADGVRLTARSGTGASAPVAGSGLGKTLIAQICTASDASGLRAAAARGLRAMD